MKKKIFSLLFIAGVALVSCKKDDETPSETPTPTPVTPTPTSTETNKWKVNGVTYTHTTSSAVWNGSGTHNGLMGNGSNDSLVAFQIWFHSTNPSTGTYKIMSGSTKVLSTDPTIVSVNASLGSKAWFSADNAGTVNVTNTNGVISATLGNTVLRAGLGTSLTDTVVVSGNLTFK